MSRVKRVNISVHEPVHRALDDLRLKGESYNAVITKLLKRPEACR